MCWYLGHVWYYFGETTGCRFVYVCSRCGTQSSVTTTSIIMTSTIVRIETL